MTLAAEHFRRHALEGVLAHWWRHAADRAGGGFYNGLDREWKVTDAENRSLVATARLVYGFSQGHMLGGPDWCTEAARHGLDVLLGQFRDEEHGGWFWQVRRDGGIVNDAKRTYGHAFAILALSEYCRAFDDAVALSAAEETFDVLERHVYDPDAGGYRETLARDWTSPEPMRTQNSQMHMVEALLALQDVSGRLRYLDRAVALCDLMAEKLFDDAHGCLPEFFRDDWSDLPEHHGDPIMPGHQLEWAWLLVRVYGHHPEPRFAGLAGRLAEFAYAHGWDEEFGGWYDAADRTGRVTRDSKGFWPQCEAVMAALWLWGHTGDERHREVFERSVRYGFDHFADAEFGGWFTSLSRDGTVRNAAKGSAWKADYHVVQMCAETWRFLSARGG